MRASRSERIARIREHKEKPIPGKLVSLVPSKAEHAAEMCRLRNQPRAMFFLIQGEPLTVERQRAWIERTDAKDDDISWVVFDRRGQAIGTNAFYDIDLDHGTGGEKGRQTIDDAVGPRGPFALEADLLVIRFAFEQLDLDSVRAAIRFDNEKVHSMNERMGFVKTGEHVARDILHFDFALRRERFDPRPLDEIIEHWSKRNERGKA